MNCTNSLAVPTTTQTVRQMAQTAAHIAQALGFGQNQVAGTALQKATTMPYTRRELSIWVGQGFWLAGKQTNAAELEAVSLPVNS